jgi:hypothetical protein
LKTGKAWDVQNEARGLSYPCATARYSSRPDAAKLVDGELYNSRHPMPDPVAELHDSYRQAGISPEWAQEEAARYDAARPKRKKWPWQ